MFVKIAGVNYGTDLDRVSVTGGRVIYQDGEKWMANDSGRVRSRVRYAVARGNDDEPAQLTLAYMNVDVVPVLDSGRLDMTKKIDVDGKLTIEISQI